MFSGCRNSSPGDSCRSSRSPAPKNPSDLCTKNVPVAFLEQYLGQLNVYFEEGRAAVAQNLHALKEHSLVIAHPCVGVQLLGKIGGQDAARVDASSGVGDLLPEVIGGSLPGSGGGEAKRQRAKKHRAKTKTPEERHVDSWLLRGDEGVWQRAHRTPRRSMFTPHNVAGKPDDGIVLNKIRVTRGKYVGTGENFELIDDYSIAASTHKMLPHAWVGTTEFREVDQQIMNNITSPTIEITKDKTVAWADMLSGDEETSDTRVCGALTSLAPRVRCPAAPLLSGEAMPGLRVGAEREYF